MTQSYPTVISHSDTPLALNEDEAYIEFLPEIAADVVASLLMAYHLTPVGPGRAGAIYTVNDEYTYCRWVRMPPGMSLGALREIMQWVGLGPVWVSPVYRRQDLADVPTGISYTGQLTAEVCPGCADAFGFWLANSNWELAPPEYQLDDTRLYLLQARPGVQPDALLDALDLAARTDLFTHLHPNWLQLHACLVTCTPPDDPLFLDPQHSSTHLNQWNLHDLGRTPAQEETGSANAECSWNDPDGPEVIVAVIDSGCDLGHPDLAGRFVDPSEFLNLTDLTDPLNVSDTLGHGTKVSGIIAATASNGLGIAGMAKPCRLLPIRLNATKVTDHHLMRALRHARIKGARVANVSLVLDTQPTFTSAEIANAENHGLLIVAAAGNASTPSSIPVRYPAREGSVLAVGAVIRQGLRWQVPGGLQSCYGVHLDLTAPGARVWTTDRFGAWVMATGTSMAAPHVAGLAALVQSRHNQKTNGWLSNDDVRQRICSHARKVGGGQGVNYIPDTRHPHGTWSQEMGYGVIDVKATLDAI